MNNLIIPDELSLRARAHLFSDAEEHFIFFLCTVETKVEGLAFAAKDVILIADYDLELSGGALSIRLEALLRVMNRAAKEGLALVEGHSHPRGFGRFSYTDKEGFEEFVPYVLDVLKKPYGATVWDGKSVIGACWKTPERQERLEVEVGSRRTPNARRPKR